MSTDSSAIRTTAPPLSALGWGLLGVVGFSFSLPATRLAVEELDGTVVGLGRALVAAALAAIVLALWPQPRPTRAQWRRLAVVAVGVVVGFPLLTALALRDVPSSHGAVLVGFLPAATAVMAVLRAGERPSRTFWLATLAGLVAVVAFALSRGAGALHTADVLLLAAVVLCALGYAEGGALARELGGWQVICWALLLSAPVLAPVVGVHALSADLSGGAVPWLGFAYVSVVSMFLGFFAWYRGLALGGVARIGQVQLAQPVLTLGWSAALLGEVVDAATLVAAAAVLGSVVLTQRARGGRAVSHQTPAETHPAVRPARERGGHAGSSRRLARRGGDARVP